MQRSPLLVAMSRQGFAARRLLAALVAVLALPALGYGLWSYVSEAAPDATLMTQTVERSEFLHEITDRGNVESANNVEIRCEVRAKGGGTTILELVPEGARVNKGDVLMRLDSSALENDRTSQLIVCSNSEATLIQSQKALETAKIAKQEYLEGQYVQLEKAAENECFMAREEYSKAVEYLGFSKRLAVKGYVTQKQLENDQYAVEKGKKAVEIAEKKLEVLRTFTLKKMLVQLESDIKTAEARLRAQEASHKLDMAQLELIESQIAKCVIHAPQDGQVVYANETNWRGAKQVLIDAGEQVRERQVLIRMPDSTRMQVIAKVNEGNVSMVSIGMPAVIHLDAFPDIELRGKVEKVAEFPVPASFMGSSVKEYETTVSIAETPPGLRPGLTAEVRIQVEQLPNVLQVPVQSVFEHGGQYYCVVSKGGHCLPRKLDLGSSNDKTVVVRRGLSEGEQVVLNASSCRGDFELPDLPPADEQVAAHTSQAAPAPDAKIAAAAPAVGNQPPAGEDPVKTAERMFRQYDKDGDGKLHVQDLPKRIRAAILAAGTKDDDVLDQAKWVVLAGRALKSEGSLPKPGPKL